MAEQRLPIVDGDDGQWGDILNQFISKEHYDSGVDNTDNGGHQAVTVRPGTTSAGTAPIKLSSGPLMTTPESGAVEFLSDRLYFTQTTDTVRKVIAAYDDSSGATGDVFYRDSDANFVRLPIGSGGDLLTVAGGLPSWGSLGSHSLSEFTNDATSYAGFEQDNTITSSSGNITVPANVANFLVSGNIIKLAVPQLTDQAVPDDVPSFVVANYNSGSPVFDVISDETTIDYELVIPYAELFKKSGNTSVHIQRKQLRGHGEVESNNRRIEATNKYGREPGSLLSLAVDSSLNITLGGGNVWSVNYLYNLSDVTTATRQFKCLNTSGTWTYPSNTSPVLDNMQYNDPSSGYVTLPDGEYGITYVFRGVEDADHIYTVLGDQSYTSAELAKASKSLIDLPAAVSHAIFVGRVIVQKAATTGILCESAFDTVFQGATGITVHGDLEGLDNDDHPQYLAKNTSITGATKTKVTYDAKGLVTSGDDATTADIADSADKRYVTDAQVTILSNTSGTNTGDQDLTRYKYSLATGIISRGVISINADTTKIDITSGSSLYVDNSSPSAPVVDVLTWNNQTGLTPPSLNTSGRLWIGIQRTAPGVGTIVYSAEFTASEKRTIAILGRVWGNGTTTVEGVGQYATPAYGYEKTLEDLMRALGSINVNGNVFSAYGSGMTLNKTTGSTFRFSAGSGSDIQSPNILDDSSETNITSYHYHLGQGATGFTTLETSIDANYYDNAGTKTAVPSDNFSIQRVYYFPKSGVIDVVYGQAVYSTLVDAVSAVSTEAYAINDANARTLYGSILRSWVIVKQGATDLSDSAQAKILTAMNTSGGASSSGAQVNADWDATSGDAQILNKPTIPAAATDANITITDVTTNDASTSKHGFFPKLPTASGKYLRDDMTWQAVSGSGLSQQQVMAIGSMRM